MFDFFPVKEYPVDKLVEYGLEKEITYESSDIDADELTVGCHVESAAVPEEGVAIVCHGKDEASEDHEQYLVAQLRCRVGDGSGALVFGVKEVFHLSFNESSRHGEGQDGREQADDERGGYQPVGASMIGHIRGG